MIAVDVETTGLDFNRDQILGIGYGDESSQHYGKTLPRDIREGVMQNGKFDYKFLKKAGFDISLEFDTMLAAAILLDKPHSLGLASLSSYYLGLPNWKNDVNHGDMGSMESAIVAEYCKRDVRSTAQLAAVLRERLIAENSFKFFTSYLMPAARMLAKCEYRGFSFDTITAAKKMEEIDGQIKVTETYLKAILGDINFRSPKQLISSLRKCGFNPTKYDYKKKERVSSTNEEALQALPKGPLTDNLLRHRELTKLLGYIEGWLGVVYNGRIYPTYNMDIARTGRLSCSNPNLQQVPRDGSIRRLFTSDVGKRLIIADYAQIEPRVAAHYSGDTNLQTIFINEIDFYGSIAQRVLGVDCEANEVKSKYPALRAVAKEIGLSILYGIGPAKLRDRIRNGTGRDYGLGDCQSIIDDYFRAYPGLLKLRKEVDKIATQRARMDGYSYVTNYFGRKVLLDPRKIYSQGVNSLIQSTASDICMFTQLNVSGGELTAIVHDEIIYNAAPENAESFVKHLTEQATNIKLNVPLKLETVIGDTWADKH